MDLSFFNYKEHLPVLAWLGRKDWVSIKDLPDRRAVVAHTKPFQFPLQKNSSVKDVVAGSLPETVVVSREEYQKYPRQHWSDVKEVIESISKDAVTTLWYLTLSKALAGGPKIFRPTPEQCEALENTEASFSFETYKQPYPVIILEIPNEYRKKLASNYKLKQAPSHVLIYHDAVRKFIAICAFFHKQDILVHITVKRDEYTTVEDALILNRRKDIPEAEMPEFEAAEIVQRLGINFAMMMTLYGTKVVGLVNPEEYRRVQLDAKGIVKGKSTNRAIIAKNKLEATAFLIEFEQKVDFYDEIVEQYEAGIGDDVELLRKSPKTHWRRGHWRQQPCGPAFQERKSVFIKPILVKSSLFTGDIKDTSVTYQAKTHEK